MVHTMALMIVRRLLGVFGCGPAPDADAVEIAVLRHQLAVLRRQVPRPRYTPADRMLLAALAKLLPRERWPVFLVTPSTLLRWHRKLVARRWTYPRTGGRRGLDQDVVELVLRRARENPRWGYPRIVGECRTLGVPVSASSVRRILPRHRLGPAPRRSGPSWTEFLQSQVAECWPATSSPWRPSRRLRRALRCAEPVPVAHPRPGHHVQWRVRCRVRRGRDRRREDSAAGATGERLRRTVGMDCTFGMPGLDADLERTPVARRAERVPTALQHRSAAPEPGSAAVQPRASLDTCRIVHCGSVGAAGRCARRVDSRVPPRCLTRHRRPPVTGTHIGPSRLSSRWPAPPNQAVTRRRKLSRDTTGRPNRELAPITVGKCSRSPTMPRRRRTTRSTRCSSWPGDQKSPSRRHTRGDQRTIRQESYVTTALELSWRTDVSWDPRA